MSIECLIKLGATQVLKQHNGNLMVINKSQIETLETATISVIHSNKAIDLTFVITLLDLPSTIIGSYFLAPGWKKGCFRRKLICKIDLPASYLESQVI